MSTNNQPSSFVLAETYLQRFIKCPICKDTAQGFTVDHLSKRAKPNKPYEFGPQRCVVCKNNFRFKIYAEGDVEIAQVDGNSSFVSCLVLLKSTHEKDPIYIMVNAKFDQKDIDAETTRPSSSMVPFYYNVNTCPTNFIHEIFAITHADDTDPHGVFEFVRLLSIPDALAIAKAHGDQIPLDSYEKIGEGEIEDAFEDHMDLLFPECIGSGNEYEGQVIENLSLPIL